MLQGKPFLPPAAITGLTARLPTSLALGSGLAAGWQSAPEDAVLLRSSRFLKMCLAPFNWGGGIQTVETGNVGEGEEKPEMVQ